MNIYDISQKAGVSIATVSRVLNQNENVSPKTRDKVMRIINETGYTPNVFARGLGLNTMRTIGILCADSSDAYLASAIYHLVQNLQQENYDTFLCCTGYDYRTKSKYMELLLSKRVDAVVLVGSNFVEEDPEQNEYIRQASATTPIIILGALLDAPNIYCILCDDHAASYQATRFLLNQKRQRPVHFCRLLSYSGIQKINGYKQAMLDASMDSGLIQVHQINQPIPQAKEAIAEIYQKYPFDAVIAADDELAISTLKFARSIGLHVPNDLSIIGYNNSVLGLCAEPELTSVDNQVTYASSTAVRVLMNVLAKEETPRRTFFSAELVIRKSTDCCL